MQLGNHADFILSAFSAISLPFVLLSSLFSEALPQESGILSSDTGSLTCYSYGLGLLLGASVLQFLYLGSLCTKSSDLI